jgi:hypothetical protein
MSETIPPSRQALAEALSLTTEILRNIELSELPLTNIALKVSRIARLLNDFDMQRTLEYEVGGYPTTPDGVPPDVYRLAVNAGREFSQKDDILKTTKKYAYLDSIGSLEEQLRNTESAIAAARDPENPGPPRKSPIYNIELPTGNAYERSYRLQESQKAAQRLASRRNFIYQYVLRKHYELKFSGIADDVFSHIRERVDATIGQTIPESVKRLSAVYENLRSDNPEDWSNAVHSCRRILQDLADSVFPPNDEVREIRAEGKVQRIKLGRENYINRIIAFIQDRSDSTRFQDIVGSHISFLGNRLDSIVEAANKGSHDTIVSREEAERYVVYTYLLVGDILSLRDG